ncbi:MAG: hypothetical protein KKB51_19935 [Candidatus Riflebacteria bacterium]|nr:hypothetical protein [Candidatus Riflebacteria bacterium]
MKNIIIGSLVVISLVFSGAASAKTSSVLVNGLQYEAGLASSAIAHKDICSIAYGKADNNVGGDEQSSAEQRIGGAPTAYNPLADGSFWVLDAINQKAKHFATNGSLISSFAFPGSSLKQFINITDMAVIPSGGFYLYNSTQGIVVRADNKGLSQVQIEGLPDSKDIGVDSKGNLLVANPVMRSLLRFNPAGELIERYAGQDLSTIVDASDKPLGVKFNDLEAELFRADKASPTVNVTIAKFPLQTPKERKAHYTSAKLIGSDAKNNLYLELIACDKAGVIHQYRVLRLNSAGKILSQADLLVIPFLAPRKKMITPDGKIFGFRSDKKSWFPIAYTLP